MDLVIDLQPVADFFNLPPDIMMLKILLWFGWLPITLTFIWGSALVWRQYIRRKWYLSHKQVFLAIDIPRGNMQSPKAVENMFCYLAGMHGTYNYHETWWLGEFQLFSSLEIVSIDGYIQYLIRTPEKFRELVESAVYSQYPDAEITEVDDYATPYPTKFPDEQYDIWGGEFILEKDNALPIRTYQDFEHTFGAPEVQYKDSMAALMDLMSSLKKGEQIWYQIILIPLHPKWSDIGDDVINKIIGEKVESKKNIVDKMGDALVEGIGNFSEFVYRLWGDIEEKKKEEKEVQFRMMNLKPRQKKQIEAIQEKVGKLCFGVKIRFIYLAKKEIINRAKAANGFVGFMKQFQASDLNAFKPDVGFHGTATKINYPIFYDYRMNVRKRKIMNAYKNRDDTAGRTPMVLNVEELATIWHFPIESVAKAPLIQKAPGRKVEPPASLPTIKETAAEDLLMKEKGNAGVNDIFLEEVTQDRTNKKVLPQATVVKGLPPDNLPFV